VSGLPCVRDWGGEYSPTFQADLVESIRQAQDAGGIVGPDGYVNVLALSGGGADGAFGAGLICGWTAAGDRPVFKLVTGISTGALIAPFAFAGPHYDPVLKRFYTTITADDVYRQRSFLSLLAGADSLADTAPLAGLLQQVVDEKLLADIAAAHRSGRRLYIGTTDLEAGKLRVWNMGVIAASDAPDRLELFRKVMLASASIPALFPPVYIPVQAGGRTYHEMHVDGGATVQVFFYGFMLDLPAAIRQVAAERGLTQRPPIRVYVIRNAQIRADRQSVKPRILPIAGRAVGGLLLTGGVGDLYRIYVIAQRDGIDFRMTDIPDDFRHAGSGMFDKGDMNRLFDLGFAMAKGGYPWQSLPPGLRRQQPQSQPTSRP
jgi:hypothetical protein